MDFFEGVLFGLGMSLIVFVWISDYNERKKAEKNRFNGKKDIDYELDSNENVTKDGDTRYKISHEIMERGEFELELERGKEMTICAQYHILFKEKQRFEDGSWDFVDNEFIDEFYLTHDGEGYRFNKESLSKFFDSNTFDWNYYGNSWNRCGIEEFDSNETRQKKWETYKSQFPELTKRDQFRIINKIKFNNETLSTAVEEWVDDEIQAEEKYGHISKWDVSEVTNMHRLFEAEMEEFATYTSTINSIDLSGWDVSKVTDMSGMFSCTNQLESISFANWDVSSVTNMSSMFESAECLTDIDIGNWDVSNVTDMTRMFGNAMAFNIDISNWDLSNVKNMNGMLQDAQAFNQDIGNWDVSNVTDMTEMFSHAYSFNQDIGDWDVSNVNDMSEMFYNAHEFNQDLSRWCVKNIKSEPDGFEEETEMTPTNYPIWGTCPEKK